MDKTLVVSGTNVEGNISSCGIETKEIGVQKDSAISLTEIHRYVAYNTCTKQIVNDYQVQEITPTAAVAGLAIGAFLMLIFIAFTSNGSPY